jgi:cysteine-rich repeat protein
MKMLRHSVAVFAVVSLIAGARCARAAIDVTGRWNVTMQSQLLGPQTGEWDLAQLGSQITVVQRWASTSPFLEVFTLRGTIDPDSGVFSFDIGSDTGCGDSRIDGTVAADGTTMSGTESLFVRFPLAGCSQAGGSFTGVRTGPLPTRCGDGMLDDAGEQCDDFNQTSGDCCSSSCQLEPAGAPCSDGNACTDDACDGAGTCSQHVDNSAPCGTSCVPGTCAAGQCVYGDPAPAGTSCDDAQVCTTGDHCDGRGTCVFTDLVTCATCEQCDPDAGCVARPGTSFSCDVTGTAILTLSVAKPAAPVVSWRRTDTSPVFRPVGDPRVDTEYTLCVFDAVGLVAGAAAAPPAGTCGARPCWRGTRTGFQYHDRARASDGLEEIDLRTQDPSHGTLKVKAKGSDLHLPASLAGIVAPVVVELRAQNASHDHDQCWQSSFPADATQRSTKTLKARN